MTGRRYVAKPGVITEVQPCSYDASQVDGNPLDCIVTQHQSYALIIVVLAIS